MNEEQLYNLSLKDYTLEVWKGKLGYPLNQKDIEELEHIIDYYEQENQQLKDIIEKVREKCKEPKKEMDYTIWLKLRHYTDVLEGFEKDIEHCLHPIITSAYKCSVKNAIKELCQIIKYKLVYKEDIKEILKGNNEQELEK